MEDDKFGELGGVVAAVAVPLDEETCGASARIGLGEKVSRAMHAARWCA